MSTAIEEVVVPYSIPLRANKTDRNMLAVFVFLSVFEIPIIWIKHDSIGLYDPFLIAYDIYLLLRTRGFAAAMPQAWRSYFLVFFGYFVYMFIHLVALPNFRSITVTLKTGETILIIFTLYTLFTRFDFSPKTVVRILAVTALLLATFQLASYFNLFRHIGRAPGLGIGFWYRVDLPFIYGVSADPAGAAAGLFILFALFARRQRDMSRMLFLAVVLETSVALLLTISRANILSLLGTLFLYLMWRSTKRIRYVLVLAGLIAVLALAMHILIDSLPPDSYLFHIIDLVRHPSHFFSRVGADASFKLRYQVLWPQEYTAWTANIVTFLFGNGIGYFGIADNTYLGLLANQGVLGLVWFMCVWYFLFLATWKSRVPYHKFTMIFMLVAGLTGDTLVTSYRTIQIYLLILFFFLYAYGGLRENQHRVSDRPLL